jgi:DNA-directed RNA polymerase specialized sigma24 family protein
VTLSAAAQGLPENTDAYAFGVAKNVYKEWVRESSHFAERDADSSVVRPGGDESGLVAKIIVDGLDRVDRHLLEEFYLNKNAETLAAEYGLSPGGLRTRIHRARKRLMRAYSSGKNSGKGETKPVAVDTDKTRGHGT